MPKRIVKKPKTVRTVKRKEFTDAEAVRVMKKVTRENKEALKLLAQM